MTIRHAMPFLLLLALVDPARAAGVVSLTWDGCTGPLSKAVAPGSTPELYVSLIGQSDVLASYGFNLLFSRDCSDPNHPGGAVPDAWRFDPAGCQGGLLQIDAAVSPAIAGCANLGAVTVVPLARYDYVDATGGTVFHFTREFANGSFVTPDPSKRYLVVRLRFFQEFGVVGPSGPDACGGLETPLCIQLVDTRYSTGAAEVAWARANACVSVNDPNRTSGCDDPTPARATTWGAIRGQYR